MTSAFVSGDTVRVATTVTDTNSTLLIDPTSVIFRIKNGATAAVTAYVYGVDPNVTRLSLGRFAIDVVATASGRWSYRIEVSGGLAGATEGTFDVATSRFP